MSDTKTIIDLLERGSDEAVAITGPGRKALTYSDVRQQVASTVSRLNELGVGRNDPVAIILPNGPEMAIAFLAIAAGATTAPLNPGYREKELQFYMSDLEVRPVFATSRTGQLQSPVGELTSRRVKRQGGTD